MHLTTPDSAVVTRRTDRRPALVSEMTTSLEGMMRRALCCAAACGLALATAPAARGDGLPVTGVDAGPDGVTNETSAVRYVTLKAGRGETLVARVMKDGGQVLRSRVLRPRFAIPAVALDATPSGLSADGRTLALIGPRRAFPQRRTRIALLDARTLRLRQVVTLRGDFSFDALSPDGRTMYLVEYLSRRDATRYAVRGFDVRAGRLLRRSSTRASRTSACGGCRSRARRAPTGAGSTRSTTAPGSIRSCTRSTPCAARRRASTSMPSPICGGSTSCALTSPSQSCACSTAQSHSR
jgi:hypothetical protein